jgi:type I restriction enzyme S subunit
LKPSDIEAIEFSLPPDDSLLDFHNVVGSHWKKIDYNYTQIQTLTNLRETLLPKLMSGEVRVHPVK